MANTVDDASLSDEELVKKITVENQELYIHIVERYQGPLIRYVTRIVKDEDIAADCVQNAFIKAYTNLRSFNTERKFSSWMYRIAHNETINMIKKHKREVHPDEESWFDRIPDDRLSAEEEVDRKLLKGVTADAMSALEEKYAEPLILFYYEAKSYQEISDILRMPIATVGTRINRAKSQLKKELEERGEKL